MRRIWKRAKNGAIHAFVRALLPVAGRLPPPAGRTLGWALGACAYLVLRAERRRSLAGLASAFPERRPAWRRATARACFRHLGVSAFESFRFPRASREELLARVAEVSGIERLDAALARGRGVVCVTGHVGNWELLAAYFAARGYGVSVVAQRLYDPRFDTIVNGARARWGIRVHPRGGSTKEVLRSLREGRMLGLLCDQDTDVDCAFVPFFGQPARTPVGPAVLARKTGAPLLTFVILRRPDGRHAIRIGEEIALSSTGHRAGDLYRDALAYTRALEVVIRAHPEQWVWMHERWKTRPPAAPSEPARAALAALVWPAVLLAAASGCAPTQKAGHPGRDAREKRPVILIDGMKGTGTQDGVRVVEYEARKAELSDDQKTAKAFDIEVRHFRAGRQVSTLRADRGNFNLETNDGEAEGNVVVVSGHGDRLETEKLRWNQTRNRFFSDVPVRVVKGTNVMTGVGLEADPNLDEVHIPDVEMTLSDVAGLRAGASPSPPP